MKRFCLAVLMPTFFTTLTSFTTPSFHEAMSITDRYIPDRAERNPLWKKIIQLYNSAYLNHTDEKKTEIPHFIHHIWLGSELPEVCKEFRKTWIAQHPQWTHILWTDNVKNCNNSSLILSPRSFDELITMLNTRNIDNQRIVINIEHLAFSTKNQFARSLNYGEKSDILRYEILYHVGGLYVDTDFKCLKPFDEIHQSCTFYTGLDFSDQAFVVFNGLIGSKTHHPICKLCIEKIQHQGLDRTNTNEHVIMSRTGPHFFSSIVRAYVMKATLHDKIVLFPVTFFYPYPHFTRDSHRNNTYAEIEKIWLKPQSFAIHFWHQSWDSGKKWLNETK
jgi:mannosyltransferase OCH1-like enzyme